MLLLYLFFAFAVSFDEEIDFESENFCDIRIVEPMHWESIPSGGELVIAVQVLGCVDLLENSAIFGVVYLDYSKISEFRDQSDFVVQFHSGLAPGHHTIHVFLADANGLSLGIRDAIMIRVIDENSRPDSFSVSLATPSHFSSSLPPLRWMHGPTAIFPSTAGVLANTLSKSISGKVTALKMHKTANILMAGGRLKDAKRAYAAAVALSVSETKSNDDGVRREATSMDACSAWQLLEFTCRGEGQFTDKESFSRGYFDYLQSLIPPHPPPSTSGFNSSSVVFGVMTGSSLYGTRVRAVMDTWMSKVELGYVYGDAAVGQNCTGDTANACRLMGRGNSRGESDIFGGRWGLRILVPPSTSSMLKKYVSRDDFPSSVPKFLLGLLDMWRRHPTASWFVISGCDTYINLEGFISKLRGLDATESIMAGGHAGYHGNVRFLSGGSGLAISRGLMEKIGENLEEYCAEWLSLRGAKAHCAPCADIALTIMAMDAGAKRIELDCFHAFGPDAYHAARLANTTFTQLKPYVFDQVSLCKRAYARGSNAGELNQYPFTGLWGRHIPICGNPAAFHYLGPRAMRLLHAFLVQRGSKM